MASLREVFQPVSERAGAIAVFRSPMINLYFRDLAKALAF
jgi:hypothetical protein